MLTSSVLGSNATWKAGRKGLQTFVVRHQSSGLDRVTGNLKRSPATSSNDGARRWQTKFAYPEGMTAYEEDYTEEAEYPEIDPETHLWNEHRRKRRQDVLDWHMKIRNASCPEAKNLEFNMPKQFGYIVYKVTEDCFDYDSLNAYKFVTRTHVAARNQLPSVYSSTSLSEKVDYFTEKVREPLKDVLKFELDAWRSFENNPSVVPEAVDYKKSSSIVDQVNRTILSILSKEAEYLKDCQVDLEPNVEAFWMVGGQEPSYKLQNRRKGSLKIKGERFRAKHIKPDDPVESNLWYVGSPLLQIRCKDPPQNFVAESDSLSVRSLDEFPDRFPHFLRAYGFRNPDDSRFASIIPGHWSGDKHRCNLMAFHGRHHLQLPVRVESKHWSEEAENEDAIYSQAMLVSFGRLLGQAFYHGFDQFGDLHYPFSTQTVITDGLKWSFFAYQLNTIKLHQLALTKNQKQNVMWGTQTESIFDKEKPDELNDNVVKNLLRFYLNEPVPIEAECPTPYLGTPIQDWEDEAERAITFFNFRIQVYQRSYVTDALRGHRPPEMYEWEKIYKFYFNAMPLEARRRWFELPPGFPGSKPWDDPYKLVNPLLIRSGVQRLLDVAATKKEEERLAAAKLQEAEKYGMVLDPTNARPKKR